MEELRQVITGEVDSLMFQGLKPVNKTAENTSTISGRIFGGYTDVIASTLGTTRGLEHISAQGDMILFLEGPVKRSENELRKQLAHIRNSDLWNKISAIVFGDAMNMAHFEGKRQTDISTLAKAVECLDVHDVPIYYGLPVGHTNSATRVLPLGTDASIVWKGDEAILTVDTQRRTVQKTKERAQHISLDPRIALQEEALYHTTFPVDSLELEALNPVAENADTLTNAKVISCNLLQERNFIGTAAELDMSDHPIVILNMDASENGWPTRTMIESMNYLNSAGIFEQASAIVIGNVSFPDIPKADDIFNWIEENDTRPLKEGFEHFLRNTFRDYGLESIPLLKVKVADSLPMKRFRQERGVTLQFGEHASLKGVCTKQAKRFEKEVLVAEKYVRYA